MTAPLPAALKAADISRFALRAAQLEKPKPIVAYWCNYWIVNQILSKGLHNADQESLSYTTTLMDMLEQFKAEQAQEPAVTDDVAGKAYVEQFALETFARADNAVRANKASRQTADTFQASATFLEMLQIWGDVDPEITAKIKFAKYHALRIAKAIKLGEDPNLSNPKAEPEAEEALAPLDPNDPEVQMLEGPNPKSRQPSMVEVPDESDKQQQNLAGTSSLDQSLHPSRDPSQPPPTQSEWQPSITAVPDESHSIAARLARQSSLNESLHPSRAPSLPRPAPNDVSPLAPVDASSFYETQPSDSKSEISPLDSPSEGKRKPSIGGNYFPTVPSTTSQAPDPPIDLPSAPSEASLPPPPTNPTHQPPPAPTRNHGTFLPQSHPTNPRHPPTIPQNFHPNPSLPPPPPAAPAGTHQPPHHRTSHVPVPPLPRNIHFQTPSQPQPQPQPQYTQQFSSPPSQTAIYPNPPQPPVAPRSNVVVDEEAVMRAQKHARWAISALNFEDVPTAIRELRAALTDLGGL